MSAAVRFRAGELMVILLGLDQSFVHIGITYTRAPSCSFFSSTDTTDCWTCIADAGDELDDSPCFFLTLVRFSYCIRSELDSCPR